MGTIVVVTTYREFHTLWSDNLSLVGMPAKPDKF